MKEADRSLKSTTPTASLLYHMGRIFQEQRPQPVVGMRAAVDSKLSWKIREKKIAMGHKPDDHEERTVGWGYAYQHSCP